MACENIEILGAGPFERSKLACKIPCSVKGFPDAPPSGLTLSSIPSDMVCMNTDVVLQTSLADRAAMLLISKAFEFS